MNSKDETIEYNEPSHFVGLFYPFFHGTLMVLAVLLVFGVVYEVLRLRLIRMKGLKEKVELCGPCKNGEAKVEN